jgi:5-methylcytosine-specific restriction enzyme A
MAEPSSAKPAGASRWGNGRGGRPWRRIVERVKTRDQYTCRKCGRVTLDGEVDHITSTSKGGTDDDANLQYLCKEPCHGDKTRAERGGKVKQSVGDDGWPRT